MSEPREDSRRVLQVMVELSRAARLEGSSFDAGLVGEGLVTEANIPDAVRDFLSH
jgi:hypothetical protein